MDRRQIGLKLSLDHLGLDFKVDSFEDRLILQKAICLAQAAGVKLGYYYGWYLHGPYCPALARDAYSVKGELDAKNDESTGWSLSAESQACLEKVRPLMHGKDRKKLSEKLELLASIFFLVDTRQVSQKEPSKLGETLRRFEKPFTDKQVAQALGELKQYGLLR